MYRYFIKRIFDLLGSLFLLILALPLMLSLIFILLITYGNEPFFFQRRLGKNGKIFTLVKFKTMNDLKDDNGKLLPDSERLLNIGKILRRTSLDELPQLWNVIKGDMSLVGPRPLLVQYLPLYNEFQKRRHEVNPGITGWAQVNGRNAIDWQKKFDFDVWYVDNIGFFLDVKILWRTFLKVIQSEGINQEGMATMELFKGN